MKYFLLFIAFIIIFGLSATKQNNEAEYHIRHIAKIVLDSLSHATIVHQVPHWNNWAKQQVDLIFLKYGFWGMNYFNKYLDSLLNARKINQIAYL